MSVGTVRKVNALASRLMPELKEELKTLLYEKNVIPKKDFAEFTGLLVDAFDETLAEQPNEKRMERKLRDHIFGILNIEYEGNIEDDTLRRATKIIREKIVRKGEREKLAGLLAKDVMGTWISLDEERKDNIAGFDGLLERLQDKVEGDLDFSDDELLDIMLELGAAISGRYMEMMKEEQIDELLDLGIEICEMLEKDEKVGDKLLEFAQRGLNYLGFISMMRRAFAGLLLSDLIISQIGKSLGIKEKISVTDFIIFISVKIAETEVLKDADKADVGRIKKVLKEVRAM